MYIHICIRDLHTQTGLFLRRPGTIRPLGPRSRLRSRLRSRAQRRRDRGHFTRVGTEAPCPAGEGGRFNEDGHGILTQVV